MENITTATLLVVAFSVLSISTMMIIKTPEMVTGSVFAEEDDKDYNVILLSIDTLRADHLQCYGYGRETAASICELAEDGVLFETCITNSPWTMPAVMSMITGLYPLNHNVIRRPDSEVGSLSHSKKTLAELLKGDDYAPASFVANKLLAKDIGYNRGFDTYIILDDEKAENLTNLALEWLEENRDEKFFLWLHYMDPHWHYGAPYPFSEIFTAIPHCSQLDDRLKHNAERVKSEKCVDSLIARHDNEIVYTDYAIGKMIRYLKDEGLYDNTIIIVTADHGEGFLEHDHLGHGNIYYDEALRIPLIIIHPDYGKGERIEDQVSLIDIMPTVLEFLDIEAENLDGESLVPLMENETVDKRPVISQGHLRRISVRTDEWKFVDKTWENGTHRKELYDLVNDSSEKTNLYDEMVDVSEYFEGIFREHFEMYHHNRTEDDTNSIDMEKFNEMLRSLGYMT